MYLPGTYSIAALFMFITMLCWGSWANCSKIDKEWRFELFYWDYAFGVLVMSLIFGLTMGTFGHSGTSFLSDLFSGSLIQLLKAFLGGVLFNIANILLVAAITIAGMAVAFPIAIGIALVVGTILSFVVSPQGSAIFIFFGVALILTAIILDAFAYKRASPHLAATKKGIGVSLISGILMSLFYPLVAESMYGFRGLSPYSAVFVFALGLFICNLFINYLFMKKPITGGRLTGHDYTQGRFIQHLWGWIGGIIWCTGMTFNVIASTKAGPAIAYAFGQGATLIAAIWGVFIWKEFKEAKNIKTLLTSMFLCYLLGLFFIGFAKLI